MSGPFAFLSFLFAHLPHTRYSEDIVTEDIIGIQRIFVLGATLFCAPEGYDCFTIYLFGIATWGVNRNDGAFFLGWPLFYGFAKTDLFRIV